MRRKHVNIKGGTLRFEFTGKSGKQWKLRVEDKRIVAITKRCADIPGHETLQISRRPGEAHAVDSGDVNSYIKEVTQQDFTAKGFQDMGRDGACRPRFGRIQEIRQSGESQAQCGGGDREGSSATRKHAGDMP